MHQSSRGQHKPNVTKNVTVTKIRDLVKLWRLFSFFLLALSSIALAVDASNFLRSKDIPSFFGSVTEFTAGHASTQAVVADTDRIVFERVGKVIVTLGHGSDKDANAFLGAERLDIVSRPHHGGLVTESHFTAVGRKVVRDGIFDDFEQLLLGVGRADRQPVKELNHQPSKPLEGPRNTYRGVDLDEDSLGGMDVDLQPSGLVDGGVEEGEKALDRSVTKDRKSVV